MLHLRSNLSRNIFPQKLQRWFFQQEKIEIVHILQNCVGISFFSQTYSLNIIVSDDCLLTNIPPIVIYSDNE